MVTHETGWLIEVIMGGRAWWWAGHHPSYGRAWTTNASDAIRFARKLDGERVRDRLRPTDDYMLSAIVTDHMWISSEAV